jgi:site-specific DNA recombinase
MKAYAYLRLSVDKENGEAQSLDAQRFELRRYAKANSIDIVQEFVESGVSGRRASRPEFDRMLAMACQGLDEIDAILTYRLDRFTRNQQVWHNSLAALEKADIEFISVSEQFGGGRNSKMAMSITAMVAEHQSLSSSIHTAKSRRENARQGYFNGGVVPFGYSSQIAATSGQKNRMRLVAIAEEADVVKEIFDWAACGRGGRWIAKTLNSRGTTLRGKKFNNSNLSDILARDHYRGTYYDRTVDENGKRPEHKDWIAVPCPQLIENDQFDAVSALRASRNPRKTPPHVAAGITLLTGIAKCGDPSCTHGLTIRSGKSGQYQYYSCNGRVNSGGNCSTPNIRREKLDEIVIEALETRLLKPERLQMVLADIINMSDHQRVKREKELAQARAEQTRAGNAIKNLLQLIEEGHMNARDHAFAERLATNKQAQAAAGERVTTLESQLHMGNRKITPETIAKFSALISRKLRGNDSMLRTAYTRMFVAKVTVSQTQIVICGPKSALEAGVAKDNLTPSGLVPSFDQKWCPEEDSNLHAVTSAST